VPPDGKFKIASFVVSPSACHRQLPFFCNLQKLNVLCCSVQLPIYVKPQITCDGNTAQVNIMVCQFIRLIDAALAYTAFRFTFVRWGPSSSSPVLFTWEGRLAQEEQEQAL
jgi:hypothetical protein